MKQGKKIGKAVLVGVSVLLKCALLLPIAAVIVWVNYTTAASAEYNLLQFERECATAILNGEAILEYDTINERLVQQLLIESLEEPFDTIALGSSRILQLDSATADGGSFYNCGLSGADYRDVMNTYYMFEKADMLPENIIIGLDPWLFNADPLSLHAESDAELFEEFITLRLGYSTDYVPPQTSASDYAELLSPAAFQQNLAATTEPQSTLTSPNIAQGDLFQSEAQIKSPDGSVIYPLSYRTADQDVIDGRALTQAGTFLRMEDYEAPDAELYELFHRFIQHMQNEGVNVILLMLPYHQTVYTYAAERPLEFPGFFLTEPWFIQYALQYNLPLYGSYNPFVTESLTTDFYDGLHIRGEAIGEIFPGVAAVQEAMQDGNAYSSWITSGHRIQQDTAVQMVEDRYLIPQNEPLVPAEDFVIRGELCYLVERYNPAGDVLLARYAVSRREGIIYRYDTDLSNWVIDQRF